MDRWKSGAVGKQDIEEKRLEISYHPTGGLVPILGGGATLEPGNRPGKNKMNTRSATSLSPAQLEQLSINTIRLLSVDAVQKANSGHPGLPLGAAPMVYVLWTRLLQHNPSNPHWVNLDRFVLSAGHGSMLSGRSHAVSLLPGHSAQPVHDRHRRAGEVRLRQRGPHGR